ncbi:hypothetical protein MINT15_13720 [Saccharomonospora viridis]|uniref:Uncharacterized protein n=1 Tax=Saccharomonospora viridis TaxID=1852 RepID=A0A837DAE6_9PSEU|nr:hypothetical protein MINT15_13720 [Saccharomonospora viridis]
MWLLRFLQRAELRLLREVLTSSEVRVPRTAQWRAAGHVPRHHTVTTPRVRRLRSRVRGLCRRDLGL